jgi:hypothetical protein
MFCFWSAAGSYPVILDKQEECSVRLIHGLPRRTRVRCLSFELSVRFSHVKLDWNVGMERLAMEQRDVFWL